MGGMTNTKTLPAVSILGGGFCGRVEAPVEFMRVDPWAAERAEAAAKKAAATACRSQRASEGASYASKRAALVKQGWVAE